MRIILSLFIFTLFFSSSTIGQKDWKLQKDKKGVKVWTKDYPDSKYKQFKAEARIKADLENVVAVFLAIEDMGLWYDRVAHVTVVKKISAMEGIYKIDFGLPWPVSDRVSAVRAILKHDPITNVVKVSTAYEEGIIINPEKTLVTDIHSEWILTPVEGGYVDIYHKGYMHPAGKLPAWIANSGVKEGPVKTITALKNILPNYADVDVEFLRSDK